MQKAEDDGITAPSTISLWQNWTKRMTEWTPFVSDIMYPWLKHSWIISFTYNSFEVEIDVSPFYMYKKTFQSVWINIRLLCFTGYWVENKISGIAGPYGGCNNISWGRSAPLQLCIYTFSQHLPASSSPPHTGSLHFFLCDTHAPVLLSNVLPSISTSQWTHCLLPDHQYTSSIHSTDLNCIKQEHKQ